MRITIVVITLAVAAVLAGIALGEKVDMSPKALRDTATHVVTGEVVAVYSRVETAGEWRYTRYVAEVKVATVEKGEGIAKGSLAYVRYWTRAWVGRRPMPPSTTGHRGLPEAGEKHRIYLARNAYDGFASAEENSDGGLNVIGANGFEKL
jgi:hypothetical protein